MLMQFFDNAADAAWFYRFYEGKGNIYIILQADDFIPITVLAFKLGKIYIQMLVPLKDKLKAHLW